MLCTGAQIPGECGYRISVPACDNSHCWSILFKTSCWLSSYKFLGFHTYLYRHANRSRTDNAQIKRHLVILKCKLYLRCKDLPDVLPLFEHSSFLLLQPVPQLYPHSKGVSYPLKDSMEMPLKGGLPAKTSAERMCPFKRTAHASWQGVGPCAVPFWPEWIHPLAQKEVEGALRVLGLMEVKR